MSSRARLLLAVLAASVLGSVALACDGDGTAATPGPEAGETPEADAGAESEAGSGRFRVTVHGHTDLPRTSATQALSATYYDAATNTLWAMPDRTATLVPLAGSADFRTWTPGTPVPLTGRPGATWDGEGLTRIGEAWTAVTVETVPTVERFDAKGAFLGAVTMPAVYTHPRAGNKGLESLTSSPDGAFLFTANEQALEGDGPASTKAAGSVVRILRRELATGKETQHAYRTEGLGAGTGGDMGVSELAAISATRLLVLERGYQSDLGSTVRLFHVDLTGAPDVQGEAALGATTPSVAKELVVDLGTLPADGFTHPGTQPNPILDNYEALALGPTLPDGRRLVFVTSDDNQSATQVARVLVLAVAGL